MAAWAHVLAFSGFKYSAKKKEIRVRAVEGQYFWSNGAAWGRYSIEKFMKQWSVKIECCFGQINLKTITLDNGCLLDINDIVMNEGDDKVFIF